MSGYNYSQTDLQENCTVPMGGEQGHDAEPAASLPKSNLHGSIQSSRQEPNADDEFLADDAARWISHGSNIESTRRC